MCLQSPPRFISNKLSKLFRISPEGAAALIPGLISGFPAGALSVRELYKSGRIDRAEAERLICFTNNPSAAFVTGFVGKGIFGDLKTGLCLFAALQLSTLIAALATGKGVKAPENGALCAKPEKTPGAKEFALAVKNSALSMLNIAAFITFFSVICGYISKIPAGAEVHGALYGFLEIGNGAASLSALPFGLTGSFIAAGAFIGWSGLSVHLQVATLCFDTGIRFKKYIASKLLCSALCALFCAALAPLM